VEAYPVAARALASNAAATGADRIDAGRKSGLYKPDDAPRIAATGVTGSFGMGAPLLGG
jgi:hypothetical protein